jgi:hypothetical protein
MNQSVLLQLYPPKTGTTETIEGRYLRHRLHRQNRMGGPCVYSNYVMSLDGRIALGCPHPGVPKAITSDADWRLYQELAAQADVLLTSGRYLREWAEGRAQASLRELYLHPAAGESPGQLFGVYEKAGITA